MSSLPADFSPRPDIYRQCQKVGRATMSDQVNDLDRLALAFGRDSLIPAPGLLPLVHPALEERRGLVTAVFRGDELLDIEAGDGGECCCGLAIDVGTTTVVGLLWDLSQGTLLDAEARTNYQSRYGADVISRIQFCMQGEDNLRLLQERIISCCNDVVAALCQRRGLDSRHIYQASVVGNTTMSHLFLGVPPQSLARTPFAPVFCSGQQARAAELGLHINPRALVRLLPNIAGHVGSDIVAMLLTSRLEQQPGCYLAIDIGTNGEIVAAAQGRLLACSTAAGPAFEGASIHQGMRAAPGAIEAVSINAGRLNLRTIDGLPPVGICGSGLIDAVAQLLLAGLILPNGRMLSRAEAEATGLDPALCSRLCMHGEQPAFVLVRGAAAANQEEIVLTQQDVREVQLAKGAIRAGAETLLQMLGITAAQLDSILLAGAFGNYIRKESALVIGLLPAVGAERVLSIGNAAGSGASLGLLSAAERERAGRLAGLARHVELSNNEDFQDCYIEAMRLG